MKAKQNSHKKISPSRSFPSCKKAKKSISGSLHAPTKKSLAGAAKAKTLDQSSLSKEAIDLRPDQQESKALVAGLLGAYAELAPAAGQAVSATNAEPLTEAWPTYEFPPLDDPGPSRGPDDGSRQGQASNGSILV